MKKSSYIYILSVIAASAGSVFAQSGQASTFKAPKNGIVQEVYERVRGNEVGRLTSARAYKRNSPTKAHIINALDSDSMGEDYGVKYSGLFIPPKSGSYTFWLAGDDAAELYLSKDEKPANVEKVAEMTSYSGRKHFRNNAKTQPIKLDAGKKYYFCFLHKQGGGGAHAALAMEGPGIARDILTAKYVEPAIDAPLEKALQETLVLENQQKELLKKLMAQKPADVPAMLDGLEQKENNLLAQGLDLVLKSAADLDKSKKAAVLKPYARMAQGIMASPDSPVKNAAAKKLLYIEEAYVAALPDEALLKMGAHRLAPSLGEIPADAKPVSKTVNLNSSAEKNRREIVSTGIYALPGVPLTVTVPEQYANADMWIEVGHHIKPSDRSELVSAPDTTRYVPVTKEVTKIISPHGGIIFLNVPEKVGMDKTPVKFDNVIEAPRFVLGETTDEEWKTIRNNPAPWGELVSQYLTLVVPRADLQNLDNPTELMEWWNENNRRHEDFYAHYPKVAFRMHAALYGREGISYWPLEWQPKNIARLLDIDTMRRTNDALYLHEHGHHGDFGDMEIGNAAESTTNWAGYYMKEKTPFDWKDLHYMHLEKVLDPQNEQHNEIKEPGWYSRTDKGTHHWSYPITSMMIGYADDFGWDAIRTTIHRLRDQEDPMYKWDFTGTDKSDQAKVDRYLIGLSETAKRDVRPYFAHFKMLPSPGAEEYLNKLNLPKWDMSYMPMPEVTTVKAGGTLKMPKPQKNARSMAGEVRVEWQGQPKNGKLYIDEKEGDLTYVPNQGFTGVDQIGYKLINPVGKSPVKYIRITVEP